MLKKIILIVFFIFCIQIQAQNVADTILEDHSVSEVLYTKCFKNLNQGAAFFEKYPGNPVYLISGMDSYLHAKEKNENLQDDDHIVYINYAECTSPYFLSKGAAIINEQTMTLIHRNKQL